jgi:TonB family protein
MKSQHFKTIIISLMFCSQVYPQTSDFDCPPLFSHNELVITEINIVSVEVKDSANYDTQPRFVEDLEIIANKIIYPEIMKRYQVEGTVKLLVNLDSLGNTFDTEVIKSVGQSLDLSAAAVIRKESFSPAMKDDKKVTSQLIVDVSYALKFRIDKPDYIIDEIIYTQYAAKIENQIKFKLNKFGEAYYFESTNFEKVAKNNGNIPLGLFTKLNDFIISQCFKDYENNYQSSKKNPYYPSITITVKIGSNEKYVSFRESDNIPVGLWALNKLLLTTMDQIKWEAVIE